LSSFYLDWIAVLDQSNDPRGMVTGFVTSLEYRNASGLNKLLPESTLLIRSASAPYIERCEKRAAGLWEAPPLFIFLSLATVVSDFSPEFWNSKSLT
jgi:hypothetical protein